MKDITANTDLLIRFNKRQVGAFGEVYTLFYREFMYFADLISRGRDIPAEDMIQDIFLSIWEDKRRLFSSVDEIKAYVYVSIRNKFRNQVKHRQHVEKHHQFVMKNDGGVVSIAETEVFSILSRAVEVLPQECARVFRLHVEGWNIKEIAEKLNKSESTVYKQRQEAINHLKKKLNASDFTFIHTLFF